MHVIVVVTCSALNTDYCCCCPSLYHTPLPSLLSLLSRLRKAAVVAAAVARESGPRSYLADVVNYPPTTQGREDVRQSAPYSLLPDRSSAQVRRAEKITSRGSQFLAPIIGPNKRDP